MYTKQEMNALAEQKVKEALKDLKAKSAKTESKKRKQEEANLLDEEEQERLHSGEYVFQHSFSKREHSCNCG